MDIDLLARMVGELVMENDSVSLPGLGTFVAEEVPASFSDRGFTINPPYRRLSFSSLESKDTLLSDLYCSSNNVEKDAAENILKEFFQELKQTLVDTKNVVLPGLGRLRATRENAFFFVADEDLEIYPDGFGLEPVSLKSHDTASAPLDFASLEAPAPKVEPETPPQPSEPAIQPETAVKTAGPEPQQVAEPAVEAPEPELLPVAEPEQVAEPEPSVPVEEPATEPVAEPEPEATAAEPAAEQIAEPVPAAEPEPAKKKPSRLWWIIPLATIAVLVLALAVFLILAHVAPDFIDSILYTEEELRIINY